ncbi:MAG: hypothetical protein HKN40_14570 [Winogradskyella sp.]|uniref:hypothetical protein n=1 Tax=Winogradskyella sp. TaxID=1883156 RepID=UPI0018491F25|nr:hypothetical protein [Winogradskyella sp.]
MRNNILGGLVIFMVVLTCLLMIDDLTNNQEQPSEKDTVEIEQLENNSDLAHIELEK